MIAAKASGVEVVGIGSHVPDRVMSNAEIATFVDTSDEWIATRTGIRERRIAGEGESGVDLGVAAARNALADAGVGIEDVDLVVAATASPDYYFPSTAALIGEQLGASGIAAYDLSAACTGFIYALAQAYSQLQSGLAETAIVVGTEVFSRLLDWSDRSTCVLFGDGAGAVVLRRTGGPGGLLGFELGSDGAGGDLLKVAAAGHRPGTHSPFVIMDGPQVYKFATTVAVDSASRCLDAAGLKVEDVDLFVPHQANQRIIEHSARRLGIPPEKVRSNVASYGNTSAASIPLCLDECYRGGGVAPGDIVLMVGFGGGLAWGSAVLEWTGNGAGK